MICIAKTRDENDMIYTYCIDYNRLEDKSLSMKRFMKGLLDNVLIDIDTVILKEISDAGESELNTDIKFSRDKLEYIYSLIDSYDIEKLTISGKYLEEPVMLVFLPHTNVLGIVHKGGNNVDALVRKLEKLIAIVPEDHEISPEEFRKAASYYIDGFEDMSGEEKQRFLNDMSEHKELYREFTYVCECGMLIESEDAVRAGGYTAADIYSRYDMSLCDIYTVLALMETDAEKGSALMDKIIGRKQR